MNFFFLRDKCYRSKGPGLPSRPYRLPINALPSFPNLLSHCPFRARSRSRSQDVTFQDHDDPRASHVDKHEEELGNYEARRGRALWAEAHLRVGGVGVLLRSPCRRSRDSAELPPRRFRPRGSLEEKQRRGYGPRDHRRVLGPVGGQVSALVARRSQRDPDRSLPSIARSIDRLLSIFSLSIFLSVCFVEQQHTEG